MAEAAAEEVVVSPEQSIENATIALFTHRGRTDDDEESNAQHLEEEHQEAEEEEGGEESPKNDEEDEVLELEDDATQPDEGDGEDEDELAAQDADSEQYFDIRDDDILEVRIDGETVTRTIGEAKAALSGEGAIQKRLKAATLEKQATAQDRLAGMQDLEQKRTEFNNFVQTLDGVLFKPLVAPPDESLRASDTSAYLEQADAYRADQQRIVQGRAQLAHNIQDQQSQQAKNLKGLQAEQGVILTEKMPGLSDEKEAIKIRKAIASSAEHYGFSAAEVSMVADHRIFLMAHDAAQYRALKARATAKGETLDLSTNVRPARKLRSGASVSRKRTQAKQSAKDRKRVTDTARSTGRVDDVLATIMK